MSDSDYDYVDIRDETIGRYDNGSNSARAASKVNAEGIKVRGKDIEWNEVDMFNNMEELTKSRKKEKLDMHFTRRKAKAFEYGDEYVVGNRVNNRR